MRIVAVERGRERGFTLLELMIVVSILAIVASIGVPQYLSALRVARIGKAKHELVTISHAIDAYAATNSGQLPLTLHQVGFGGRRDPWGVPYCYLNYVDGTGDGLKWAIDAGIVDPAAFHTLGSGGSSSSGPASGPGGGAGGEGGFVGKRGGFVPLSHWLAPQGMDGDSWLVGRSALVKTMTTTIFSAIPRDPNPSEVDSVAASIETAVSFSMYTSVPVEATRRRDRFMFPLNTDYDLFSLGADARTSVSLGESVAQDDVIRANNGGYFGIASDY